MYWGVNTVKRWLLALAVTGLTGGLGRAQDPVDRKLPPQSVAELSAQLRTEATKLKAVTPSKLFADLGDAEIAKKLAVSGEQRNLAGRLGELTRDLIRAWLLRDLEAVPPPPATVLAERLSKRGERFRARLVAHVELIALEGILDPGQARSWRKAAGRRAQPLLSRRMALVPRGNMPTEDMPSADLVAELRAAVPTESQSWLLINTLLGGLRPSPVVLSSEQQTILRRLNELTVAIMRTWLTRGLDAKSLPSWSVLFDRVAWSDRIMASVGAHTEVIALEGILTAQQADRVLGDMWKSAGLSALLDPQLASRLRLTKAQQEQVRNLLLGKAEIRMDHLDELTQAAPLLRTMPDGAEQLRQMKQAGKNRVDDQEAMVWDVLTSAQARELARILGKAKESGPQPAQKRKESIRPS